VTLYYRHLDAHTVQEWCYLGSQYVDLGTYRLGPNWKRWLSGDTPLCVTLADGRQFAFDRLEEVA
jgi:hypothetical protein